MHSKIILFIIGFLISNLLFKIFISKLSKKFIDIPNKRSLHIIPTPRGGGIIFIFISIISSLIYILIYGFTKELIIPFLILPLGIIGFIDDYFTLKPKVKYLSQLLTCIFIYPTSNLFIGLTINNLYGFILFLFIIIFLTAVINFVNFMDGIDGLVASCMFISISTTCIVLEIEQSYLFLLSSLIAFILLNWHPAKLFMGDSGSTFLAAINISLICMSNDFIEAFNLLLILSPLLIDPFICVLRRIFYRQNIFLPHRLHLYQRLNLKGINQEKICLIYITSTSLIAISNIFLDLRFTLSFVLITFLLGIYFDQVIAEPFKETLKKSRNEIL